MKTLIRSLFFVAVVVMFGSGCQEGDVTVGNCGPSATALHDTILPIGGTFYIGSGNVADPSQSCEAKWTLQFLWANLNRRKTDTSEPPLNDIMDAFHVNSDNLSYRNDMPIPTRILDAGNGYRWFVSLTDHYSSDDTSVNYYIKTWNNSNNPADSIEVDGTVDYYVWKH